MLRRKLISATTLAGAATATTGTMVAFAQTVPNAARPGPSGQLGSAAGTPPTMGLPIAGDPSPGAARPVNLVTAWVDASAVYGLESPAGLAPASQSVATPASLREAGTGRLRTSDGNNLPIESGAYLAGDPRAGENPDLTAMHVLLMREHNWHADRLTRAHKNWAAERVYQMARAIVAAEIQQITYTEFLPRLLGPRAIPPWQGHRATLDPTLSVEFAVAALRFGHSIVSENLMRLDEVGNPTGPTLNLRDAFHMAPSSFAAGGGADGFLRHLCSEASNPLDAHIVGDLRNFLSDPPVAIDLAAINIQRARDTGLAQLNATRLALGLRPHADFAQLVDDPELAKRMAATYRTIDAVDLWTGGLAERKVPGAMVGETFHRILTDQFLRLRDADRFWWENLAWDRPLSAWIRGTTLADLVVRNTDTKGLQLEAFNAVERPALQRRGARLAVARPDPHTGGVTALPDAHFRSFTGGANASATDTRNAVGQSYRRLAPARFADGVHAMPTGDPHPRTISNQVIGYEGTPRPERASAMLYAWGQFLTHDLTLEKGGSEDASMIVPAGDPILAAGTVIPMRRVAWVTA
jgi:hypothetical protein